MWTDVAVEVEAVMHKWVRLASVLGVSVSLLSTVIVETREVPIDEALAMVRRGEIVDGKTIVGLYRAADALREAA